ncbi:MAG: hypothetical protein WCF95_08030, partial [bacterium]
MLEQNNDINYALLRLHRFKILDKFIPGYEKIRNRFLQEDQEYTADNLTLRTLEALEYLAKANRRLFRESGKSYSKIRENRGLILSLRLAVLMRNVVEDEMLTEGIFVPSSADYQRKVIEQLTTLGWDKEPLLADRITWLLYVQNYMKQKDFGALGEKLLAVEFLSMAMKELLQNPENPKKDLQQSYSMAYAMAAASRVAHAAPENLPMLRREGLRSSLGHLDIIFETAKRFFLPRETATGENETPQFDAPTILEDLQTVEAKFYDGDSSTRRNQFQQIWKIVSGHSFQQILERYLMLVPKGDQKDFRARLQTILSGAEAVKALYQRYHQSVSLYCEVDLPYDEIVEQMVHLAHLEWLLEKKNESRVAMLATPLVQGSDRSYELLISTAFDEPGLISVFSRVLKENGFVMENINPRYYALQTTTIVFLGSFTGPGGNASEKLKKIQSELDNALRREPASLSSILLSVFTTKINRKKASIKGR